MKVAMMPFGAYDHTVALTRALADRCEVDFYCSRYHIEKRDPALLNVLDGHCNVHLFGKYRLRDPRNWAVARRLVNDIACRHYDVIHMQEYGSPWLAMHWRRLRDVPLVMTVHDPYQHPGLPFARRYYEDRMQACFVRRADTFIVHGQLLKEQLVKRYDCVAADSVHITRLGNFDITKTWAGTVEPTIEKQLLFFGEVRPNKGLEYLLKAEPILRARTKEFKIVVAGHCADPERYETLLEPGAHVEFINKFIPNEELPGYFQRAYAVVLPYVSATQSGLLAMAMSYGKPTVASRVGAIPEILYDGETGLLVNPCNPEALADALEKLITNPDLTAQFGRNALMFSQTELSWDKIAEDTLAVYQSAFSPR